MRFSAKRWAYSDMPSFSSQSAICCMAVTDGLVVAQPSYGHANRGVYPDIPRIARHSSRQEVVPGAHLNEMMCGTVRAAFFAKYCSGLQGCTRSVLGVRRGKAALSSGCKSH